MDPLSVIANAVSIADLVLKIGGQLYEKYSSYRNAPGEIFELYVRYEGAWLRISEEVEISKAILHVIGNDLAKHFGDQLLVLESKLAIALAKLNKVIRDDGQLARAPYALWRKGPLTAAVDDLEQWMLRFYPSWFSTARTLKTGLGQYITSQQIAQSSAASSLENMRLALHSSHDVSDTDDIFLDNLILDDYRPISDSSAALARQTKGQSVCDVIVDQIDGPESGRSIALSGQDIGNLAKKLATVDDPHLFGLLKCQGVQKQQNAEGTIFKCWFIFSIPAELSDPLSLRRLFSLAMPPLDQRVHLAKLLARSIMFVHTYDFVHKDIRPENILVFRRGSYRLGASFLTGFKEFRSVSGPTGQRQKDEWEKDLYRHPSRQGIRPDVRYAMQHDIYSLGVCLLEIGLWSSFILPGHSDGGDPYSPAEVLKIGHFGNDEDRTDRAWKIKGRLTELTKDMLPAKMGTKYTNIVLTCLTAWEDKSQDTLFGTKSEFTDQEGVLVGVRFSETVLLELEEIIV